MNDLKGAVEGIYHKFFLRDFLGFWIPGLVFLLGFRSIFPSLSSCDPVNLIFGNEALRYACIAGLPYGAGVALQVFPSLSERLWLRIWGSSLKDFYSSEKTFLEETAEVPFRQAIRERVAFLMLMVLKLSIAVGVLLFSCGNFLAALLVIAFGFAMHVEFFHRYFLYTGCQHSAE